MSVVENIIAMVVLMGLLLAAFVIITGLNVNFFTDVVDTSVKEYNTEKYQNDLDAVLNTTEPVSGNNYAGLLADAVYYRKSYFDYNAQPRLEINEEIGQYYNNMVDSQVLDKNVLKVNKLIELTFDKLYGENNYYLEIAPLILKLRLYFVIDGSPSLENEISELKRAIPELIADFNTQFDVAARVFVLAGGGLDQLDPCADLQQHAECRYLRKEEMYSGQVGKGWLINKWKPEWRANNTYNNYGRTRELSALLSAWPYYLDNNTPTFGDVNWGISADEFLDESTSDLNHPTYFCSWVDLNKDSFDSFKMRLDFTSGAAGVKINKKWYTAQSGLPIDLRNDFSTEINWQLLCIGYRPSGGKDRPNISYSYIATKDGKDMNGYFSIDKLFAFRSAPEEYKFSEEILGMDLNFSGGIFYEDWATASVYAATIAEKENPATLTVIIPISDELSLGSEAMDCDGKSGFYKLFCERCNKTDPNAVEALKCPIKRSSEDVNRAIRIIQPYLYSVFPVLANSCDIADPYRDNANLVCGNFHPYGDCGDDVCGQCFGTGEHEWECPGLTLENPSAGIYSSKGCDKKQCREFIKEDMQRFAAETGGKMVELTEISKLYENISDAIKETIEKYKIKAGEKKPEEERFAYKKLVPLSNRLFADLKFWHYKQAADEE
jgi:hypothetical protein